VQSDCVRYYKGITRVKDPFALRYPLGNAVYCSREPEFYIAWSPLCPTALFTGTAIDVSIPIPI